MFSQNIEMAPLITKTELFDVDVLQKLVIKDGITHKDKADLQRYRRRRINGNEVLVAYDFAKDYKSLKFGRLYPSPHCGLSVFSKDIRAALAQKYYWDIDIENAQPVMLVVLAKKFNVECPSLQEYCDNREKILEEIAKTNEMNRDEAKTLCISVLFGGYRDQHPLLPKIYSELKELSFKVAAENPKLFALCKTHTNSYASCLSLFIQNEERKVLEYIDESMTSQNRSFDVLIFDGGLVRKLENETSFPSTLLSITEKFIFDKTGYQIHLINKPLTHTFDFGIKDEVISSSTTINDAFACKKFVEFNPETFLRDGSQVFMVNPSTGLWGNVTFQDFKEVLRNCNTQMIFKQEAAVGIRTFDYGGNLRNIKAMYEFLDTYSPKGKVPIEFMGSLGEVIENPRVLFLFQQLISVVSKHNSEKIEYLTKYLAHTIQKPRELPGVCIIATGDQGCGKDTLFDIFMTQVIGKFYSANMKNEEFFSPYDDIKARKVMVKLEEANAKYCTENSDMLKNMITGRTVSFNPKHKSPFETENFTRYIFTTNSGNPISIEGSDRRYVFFDSSLEKIGDVGFWTEVNELLFTEDAGRILYTWLSSLDISGFSPRVFPISEYQAEIRNEYKSIERQFIDEWGGEEIAADSFYSLFVSFCKRLKLKDDAIPNKIAFGRKIMVFIRDSVVIKKRRNDGVYYLKL